MENLPITPQTKETDHTLIKPTAPELGLYLLIGFGSFILLSITLSLFSTPFTLTDTALRFLLNIFCFSGTAYFLGVRRKRISWNSLGVFPPIWHRKWLLLTIGVTFVFLPLRGLLGLLVSMLFEGGLDSIMARADALTAGQQFTWLSFAVIVIGGGVFVPISEEFFFRGLIHNWFQSRMRYLPGLLLSSAIFGLAHFDSPAVVIASFILGIVNTVAYEKSRSLWLPIAIHVFNNTLALSIANLALLVPSY